MTRSQARLSMRAIGLHPTGTVARRNHLRPRAGEMADVRALVAAGWMEGAGAGYRLTGRGIDQLRLQAGEFRWRAWTTRGGDGNDR